MPIVAGTLGRYFGLRFINAVLVVFVGIFALVALIDYIEMMRRAGVHVDPATLKPVHDPQTFETNVPGLFLAGALVSGRDTGKVFIENGRFHGEAIVTAIVERSAIPDSRA